jgi:hypothetical protein
MHRAWEEVVNILLGVALIVSPWVLAFSDQSTPMTNAVVVGIIVTALALWAMLTETSVQKWWHERHQVR